MNVKCQAHRSDQIFILIFSITVITLLAAAPGQRVLPQCEPHRAPTEPHGKTPRRLPRLAHHAWQCLATSRVPAFVLAKRSASPHAQGGSLLSPTVAAPNLHASCVLAPPALPSAHDPCPRRADGLLPSWPASHASPPAGWILPQTSEMPARRGEELSTASRHRAAAPPREHASQDLFALPFADLPSLQVSASFDDRADAHQASHDSSHRTYAVVLFSLCPMSHTQAAAILQRV
mmetsp:Transcript_76180/g.134874  ORF Transcript_76180/g.134874 Transcript_76180/m.134874 type:complete len:234 (-) Transcript_76180:1531-2232(-)